MNKKLYPTIGQANLLYLIMIAAIMIGTSLMGRIWGIGVNAWVNEYLFILFPVLLLAGIKGWSLEKVCKYRGTTVKNSIISILSGISIWFFSTYLSKIIGNILEKIGTFSIDANSLRNTPSQSVLILIALVVLAPICEETFFRGFLQKAYESYSKKYAFVITAFLFGMLHIGNGINQVVPVFAIGMVLGYLVYRSGSIVTSMLAHSAINSSAVIFGGVMGINAIKMIPVWLHFAGLAGLSLAILLVRFVSTNAYDDKDLECEPESDKHIVRNTVLLIISLVILLGEGGIEIAHRVGIL